MNETTLRSRGGLKRAILERLTLGLGVEPEQAGSHDWLQATALAVRERIVERWHETSRQVAALDLKQVSYLSMEFLLSRELENALRATGLEDECRAALQEHGVSLDALMLEEAEPALGNGGLGRLAACFLDSMASLGLPAIGYGLRYEYGMFRQVFVDGWQVEQPDPWAEEGSPWEIPRPHRRYRIRFGGRVEHREYRAHWVDTDDIYAIAYDTPVPGHDHPAVNMIRLWSARPVASIDLGAFNRGAYLDAMAPKIHSKTVTRVLYPNDSTPEGRELRLRQEHFFVSASIQDVLARFLAGHCDWELLPQKAAIHLNDTHPALAPAELMRLLVDEHRLEWNDAWRLTSSIFSYTNHTLMPEGLECWPIDMMERVVPRHLEIIREIDARLVSGLMSRSDLPDGAVNALTLFTGELGEQVNMGRLSVVASRKVNGVSRLHSALVRERLFPHMARLEPGRFENVTNGVTPRRWLLQSNPALSALIDSAIGAAWRRNTEELADLHPLANDAAFCEDLLRVKRHNKVRLGNLIRERIGLDVDPDAMIDVQVKRIHEYKRQLLNILGIVDHWNAIRRAPHLPWQPRVAVIAGKAASSYWVAKLILKLANDVAGRINDDPETGGRLKLAVIPNYNVWNAMTIIPAADVSQQISLAGTEASGTGNMKLALNGALTLGTRDGANIEIAEAAGEENLFLFGLTVDEAEGIRARGQCGEKQPDAGLDRVIEQIASGFFSPDDPGRYRPLVESLAAGADPYLVTTDFPAYRDALSVVDRAWKDRRSWAHKSCRTIAAMAPFSSDRAVRDYADHIWQADLL